MTHDTDTRYDITFVDEFTDAFRVTTSGCDGHSLNADTILTFRDDILAAEPGEAVAVRGEHPWEYRHYTRIRKHHLTDQQQNIREVYDDNEDLAEKHIQHEATPEAVITDVADTLFRDANATPHQMTPDDYDIWIEIIDADAAYYAMIGWEPRSD